MVLLIGYQIVWDGIILINIEVIFKSVNVLVSKDLWVMVQWKK